MDEKPLSSFSSPFLHLSHEINLLKKGKTKRADAGGNNFGKGCIYFYQDIFNHTYFSNTML